MENINKFAPVIIPTLNRYDHFHRLVESLSKSPEAKDRISYRSRLSSF